jgi:RimJ/RimL family protein N-acetyltransferase
MNLSPVTLRDRWVVLEPLDERHAADLCAAADPTCFQYSFESPASWDLPGFRSLVARARGTAGRIAFAVLDGGTGRAVGTTSYLDIQAAHRGVEIGFTWYARTARGTCVNPAAKLLLMGHAFEDHHAERVQLKCDARNVQSQRAIAGLGAVREGVLRRHRVLPDGFVRDTVMFSVVASEWPGVRAGLEARLSAG